MMLCLFANLVWLGFHSMLGLGLCVFDVGVRVMVRLHTMLGLGLCVSDVGVRVMLVLGLCSLLSGG